MIRDGLHWSSDRESLISTINTCTPHADLRGRHTPSRADRALTPELNVVAIEGQACSDQSGNAERVACGIQQDPPPAGVRLEVGLDGTQSEQASLSGVQVVDA